MATPVPIEESIIQMSSSLWRLGSTVQCERVAELEKSSFASRKDGDSWYTLRLAPEEPQVPREIVRDSRE